MLSLIYLSTFVSLTLLVSSNPLMILISILIQTTIICVMIWMLMKTGWFSFILFLIFLGGLMVLFIYVVSLASNEKFEFNYKDFMMMTMIIILGLILTQQQSFFSLNQPSIFYFKLSDTIKMIFSDGIMITTMMIMSYLLFTLIVAVKISSKSEGPLRNFIN